MIKTWYKYSYKSRKELRRTFFIFFVFISILCVCSFIIQSLFLLPVKIGSNSMNPEITVGDCLMITPLYHNQSENKLTGFSQTVRGSLVYLEPFYPKKNSVFKKIIDVIVGFFTFQQVHPFSDSTLMGESSSIRRLIGIPGDTIYMENFILYIKPLDSSYFLTEFELTEHMYDVMITDLPENFHSKFSISGSMSEITLGQDEYFLLADNRMGAIDSRMWGGVHASQISGKVFLRYSPLRRFTSL